MLGSPEEELVVVDVCKFTTISIVLESESPSLSVTVKLTVYIPFK
ncbi:MAG: hypothetical protein ACTSVU_09860 [Promethearchaeota archaeon]